VEVKLHKLDREEDGGHDFWGYTKTLAGKEDRAVCNLIIAACKIFTGYCQGMAALA